MSNKKRVALLGASGYTGADVLRLGLNHPHIDFVALSAERQAGKSVSDIWPHLFGTKLPTLRPVADLDLKALGIDALFTCLPHATTHSVLGDVLEKTDHPLVGGAGKAFKIIDLSADFRLRNTQTYADWYGGAHAMPTVQPAAVYGLSEHYRSTIQKALLVACPGCYPTAVLLALLPLVQAGLIQPEGIHIDAKSGVTGAGRAPKEATLFAEVAEAVHPYGLGGHRHTPEIEQEIAVAAGGGDIRVDFIPHLLPMNRGELVTISVQLAKQATVEGLKDRLSSAYKDAAFVHVLPGDKAPATRMVRGSNHCVMNIVPARRPGHAILVAAIDNLVKGSSGQALQNFNLMMGYPETLGLEQIGLFP